MAGAYGPPYRAPCNPGDPGNWPTKHGLTSGCYNHTKVNAQSVPYFPNTTKVDDWRDPMDPNFQPDGIPPYPRKSDAGCDMITCSRDTCTDDPWPDTGDCPGVCGSPCDPEATFEQLCDSWFTGVAPGDPPAILKPCGGTTIDFNCYERLGIVSATNSGPNVIVTTNVRHNLADGQMVRLIGVTGVEQSVAAHPSNDTTFSVVGHITSAYTSGGFVNLDLSVCRKVGFKNAQARKAWHGIFGFDSQFNQACYDLSFPGDDGCGAGCSCLWVPYAGTPDETKYCDWTVNAHSETNVASVTTAFADLIRSVSVSKTTGCQSVTSCSDSYSDIGTFTALQDALTGATTVDPCSLGIPSHLPPNGAFTIETMLEFARPIANLFVTGGTVSASRIGCEPVYSCTATDIPSGHVITTLDVDATAGTLEFHNLDIDGNPICDIVLSVTNTTSDFYVKAWGSPGSGDSAISHIVNTLSNTYTSSDLHTDVITLLNRIDISDDIRYPWRVDGYISIAPFVCRDEGPPTGPDPSGAVGSTCPITPTDCLYTGNILGDLLPAGYGPHFDFGHISWRSCQDGGLTNFAGYKYAYGAWAKTPAVSPIDPYTFTSGTTPVVSFRTSGGTLFFSTVAHVPGWTGSEPVAICGTNAIDGLYNISGPTGTGPYEYSVIAPQIDNAPFLPGCAGGVAGAVTINSDATFYTVGDLTDFAMPMGATQWTENWAKNTLPAGSMPPGGWLIFENNYLYAQKWAEIKIHRPSYNFARPCGIDKWMLDETKVTCVESSDGSTPPTLTIYADIGLATDDLVYVCGVTVAPSVPDGVYKITKTGATTYTLTTDCNMHRVFSATQSGPNVDIVLTDPIATINSGDSVDLVGVPGLGAGLTATVTDSTHFSVPGTLSGAYAAGGFAFQSSSSAYQRAPVSIDFNCSPGPDANGIIGLIRFPTSPDNPGICGRLGVQSATQDGSEVIVTTSDTHYLQQGESVDFTGVSGLGSGLTVIVLNSTMFKVTGTLSGPYVSGGFVAVTGATDYEWYDDQSKGNFIYASYDFNFRDYAQQDFMCEQYHGGSYTVCGEAQTGCNECASASPGFSCIEVSPGVWESTLRQQQLTNGLDRAITNFTIDELCLPFSPCSPQIMAIVPASGPEVFPEPSHVEHFPSSFVSDWQYGSRWQAFYLQSYIDLLWQQPHKSCIKCDCDGCTSDFIPSGCTQTQDDGSCAGDTCVEECLTHTGTHYYAHAPEVEALQDVPAGAPTPPVGHIGFLTYADLQMVSPPAGVILYPPTYPPGGPGFGYGPSPGAGGVDPTLPAQPEMPWTLAIKEWLCICANGRFKQEYIDNGQSVFCPP